VLVYWNNLEYTILLIILEGEAQDFGHIDHKVDKTIIRRRELKQ